MTRIAKIFGLFRREGKRPVSIEEMQQAIESGAAEGLERRRPPKDECLTSSKG